MMTKEDLLKLLKENLRISVSVDERGSVYGHGGGLNVKVQVLFEDEVITEGGDTCRLSCLED